MDSDIVLKYLYSCVHHLFDRQKFRCHFWPDIDSSSACEMFNLFLCFCSWATSLNLGWWDGDDHSHIWSSLDHCKTLFSWLSKWSRMPMRTFSPGPLKGFIWNQSWCLYTGSPSNSESNIKSVWSLMSSDQGFLFPTQGLKLQQTAPLRLWLLNFETLYFRSIYPFKKELIVCSFYLLF